MTRRDAYLDAMLRHLGATYYQTLHGDATASDVARAVDSVEAEAARRPGTLPDLGKRDYGHRTGRWRVRDVMRTTAVTVDRHTSGKEIARLMSQHRVSAVPVLAGQGRVVGVVSEADLLRSRSGHGKVRLRLSGRPSRVGGDTADQLMSTPPITIHPDAPIAAAARRMDQQRVRLLPVVDAEGQLLGVLSRRNLLSILLRPDTDITDEVRAVLRDVLLIDETGVSVRAEDGVVTLDGQVATEDSHRAAVRLASDVDGVLSVIDRLSVSPSAEQPADASR